jgi:hypothetical protein
VVIEQVLKNAVWMCVNILIWGYGLGRKVGPVILAALVALHTPFLILCNGVFWINVGFFGTRYFLSSEMKCCIFTEQNECVICSPIIRPIKVLFHKLQSLLHGNTCWSNVCTTFCAVCSLIWRAQQYGLEKYEHFTVTTLKISLIYL